MESFAALGTWISENESLLSGLAAMIVVAGVVLSPFGGGLRRLRARFGGDAARGWGEAAGADDGTRESGPLTLQDLTEPISDSIQFADCDGVRIAYVERGDGPIDLVVTPGMVSHLHITYHLPPIRDTMDALAGIGRTICFDKRGQGLSDPTLETPGVEERSKDILGVMDAAGVEKAVLMGVSEGGPPSIQFAYDHPERVRGLILVGSTATWVQRTDFPIGIPEHQLDKLPRGWSRGTLRSLFFPSISADVIDDDTLRAVANLMATPDSIRQIVEMFKATDVRPLLPAIQVPTLVVHFAGDLAVPIRMGRALAEGFPNAEFFEAKGVDHSDLTQSPEALERIRTFCEDVTRA
jgi:pimeloyl-ACP methyl ester carboxylesterase